MATRWALACCSLFSPPWRRAHRINVPVARANSRYVLKLDRSPRPSRSRHARLSGIEAAEAEVVHDAAGTPGLLVRRFDRVPDPEAGVAMLAQEDACQVLARYPADKYRVTTEQGVGGLAGVCRARPVAALAALRQCAFAYLTCNGDAHAKNFSVVRDRGEWRVAPAYDLPTSYVYGDHTMALMLNGKSREDIGRSDFVLLGEGVGVRARAVERALDELCERVDLWIDDVATLPFDEGLLRKLERAIEYRRGRLTTR